MFGQDVHRNHPGDSAALRLRRGLAVAAATTLIGLTAAWSQTEPPPRQPNPAPPVALESSSSDRPGQFRLREGSELVDSRGYFRVAENRVIFSSSQGEFRYVGLENLNLERIVAEITSNPTQLEWSVSGTITEFRGTNYLLVRRAILSRLPPQLSEAGR